MEQSTPHINTEPTISFWAKLRPADIIALLVIAGGIYLQAQGIGEHFSPLMIAVVAFYFGLHSDIPKEL